MTTRDLLKRVQDIDDIKDDYEAAHGAEDQLYIDFITHVSLNPQDPLLSKKAAIVLSTQKIIFPRYTS